MALSWCTRRISNGCTKKGYIAKFLRKEFGCLEAIICNLDFELFFGGFVSIATSFKQNPNTGGSMLPPYITAMSWKL